jgi:DNA-binding NarL/FixJ family response regulator
MTRPRVLLADDHALMVDGLRKLLERDFELVGAVHDGRALLAAARALRPDVILVDISMPRLNGIDAVRQLRVLVPESRLVIVTMHADPTYVAEAFKAGASAYLVKRSAVGELVEGIRAVLRGQRYVARALPPRSGDARADRSAVRAAGLLTPRQREVLQLVAEGRLTKEIATWLGISVKTVEFHKARIMGRLDLHTTAELTRYALTHGIIA